jgi:uncharacterized protein (TIGR02598 family)
MKTRLHHHSGFSLVEVTLALAVAAFCLIVILGLLPVGLNSNQASIKQTVAASLARGIISDLRATPKTTSTSTLYSIPIPTPTVGTTLYLKQDATKAASATGNEYCVTLNITAPADSQKAATMVRLLITWPAAAKVFPPSYTGSYEIFTAIDRN